MVKLLLEVELDVQGFRIELGMEEGRTVNVAATNCMHARYELEVLPMGLVTERDFEPAKCATPTPLKENKLQRFDQRLQ